MRDYCPVPSPKNILHKSVRRICWLGDLLRACVLSRISCFSAAVALCSGAVPTLAGGVEGPPARLGQGLQLSVIGGEIGALKGQADRYDFGQVSTLGRGIEHTFIVRNGNSVPVTLTEVRPSCGCTSTLLDRDTSKKPPLLLGPGERVMIGVSVDIFHLAPGPLDKTVQLLVQGQAAPSATLEVVGTVLPPASYAPAVLDFGPVPAGKEVSRSLRVTLDSHLLPQMGVPHLVCSDPDIVVTPMPGDGSTALPLPTSDLVVRTYRLTLPAHAHLGLFMARAYWAPASATAAVAKALESNAVPVAGDVQGEVAASPSIVAFGARPAGGAAAQRVTLTGTDLASVRLSSDSPYLTVRLRKAPPALARNLARPFPGSAQVNRTQSGDEAPVSAAPVAPVEAAFLDVALKPDAPVGLLETRVRVTTASGQQLLVPVFADVSPASSPTRR